MDYGFLVESECEAGQEFMPGTLETLRHRNKLLEIWSKRPAATDSEEDIARKWLGRFDQSDDLSVREALSSMLNEGLIQKYISGGHTFYFVRDYKAIKMLAMSL